MPEYEANVYYHPEATGLTKVDELETGGGYDFDTVLVVRDAGGRLWAAHDSGCSCPTPFEDVAFPTDFIELRTADDVEPLVREATEYGSATGGDVLDFMGRVRRALAERQERNSEESR